MMTQDQLPMLDIPSMNTLHLEEMLIVNRLSKAAHSMDVEGVAAILRELLEHTKQHFHEEELILQEGEFEAMSAHKAEHDRHLHELGSLIKYFDKNLNPKPIIAYIEGNLEKWLIHHIESMDAPAALAHQKR